MAPVWARHCRWGNPKIAVCRLIKEGKYINNLLGFTSKSMTRLMDLIVFLSFLICVYVFSWIFIFFRINKKFGFVNINIFELFCFARSPNLKCKCIVLLFSLQQNKLKILDGTFHKPSDNRNAHSEYVRKHIPGAAFFDIDVCADRKSRYDHMLPSPDVFSCYVSELGIGFSFHIRMLLVEIKTEYFIH